MRRLLLGLITAAAAGLGSGAVGTTPSADAGNYYFGSGYGGFNRGYGYGYNSYRSYRPSYGYGGYGFNSGFNRGFYPGYGYGGYGFNRGFNSGFFPGYGYRGGSGLYIGRGGISLRIR